MSSSSSGAVRGESAPASSASTTRQAKRNEVLTGLVNWMKKNKRELPMRAEDVTPWGTLVGEVMSQQTPMPRVQPIWNRWMQLWPTPAALAAAPASRVLVEWGRLGYPSRALRLRECAIAISERPGGQVPADFESLCSLPGIGPYTASALMSFQFHERRAVLDTNIRRVIARIFSGIERPASSSPTRVERELADSLLPSSGAECATWNLALMEFGAIACTSKNPACDTCPLVAECAWFVAGRPMVEVKRKSQAWAGTDRQARGRVVQLLRDLHVSGDSSASSTSSDSPVASGDSSATGNVSSPIDEAAPTVSYSAALEVATLPGSDLDQAPRVIEGLLADGLLVRVGEDRLALPR